ncbi:hypothetical protein ACSBR1_012102 [Camellia fascicularis]
MLLLSSCNLREFPDFIRFQHELKVLYLQENNIHGQIPSWFLNTSKETLGLLNLKENFLTGFEQHPDMLLWVNLAIISLSYNTLQGPLPIPPLSTQSYSNNFHGPIPHLYNKGNTLKVVDFSGNQLQGKVPRSLASCTVLEILDLSNNLFEDTFPFWLVVLSKLQVLILRSNKFYGAIGSFETQLVLPILRIIDLSHNGFTGNLPVNYFQNWNTTNFFDMDNMTYRHALTNFPAQNNILSQDSYYYTMLIAITTQCLLQIKGEDSKSIGNLKGLQLLNLSNNDLSEGIPSCLGNLINLESLNLSQNKLSGKIPQQLAILTFLEFLNLSNNHLIGPIPNGKQFNTFENNSYEGNLGLCGDRLSRKCRKSKAQPPSPPLNSEQDNDSTFSSTIDWIAYAWDM